MNNQVILLDTDVVSYIFRKDEQGLRFAKAIEDKIPAISFVTPAEMYFGAYSRKWGERQLKSLSAHLRQYLIIEFNYQLCEVYGRVRSELKASGIDIGFQDTWIAATARVAQIPLLTNNVKHFERIPGIELLPID